jgi:ubiquinone/menaquinone biosynthesis C-methylase UbiE
MGTHAELLARKGARLVTIDQTAFAVGSAHRRLSLRHLDAMIVRQDAEKLAFRDGSFDTIWSWSVIHHSHSTEQCVGEIARVLKPGGRVMIMMYYRPSLVYCLHCGLIRGVLMGQLFRRRLADIRISIVGLKAELYPIPRCAAKIGLERRTPDWLANGILKHVGSMVVVEAVRR